MKENTDREINYENLDDSVIAEESLKAQVEKLRASLKQSEKERKEYLDGWQRAKADLVNARKRDEDDRREFIKSANERLIVDIIPTLESFDMAFSNKESWEKVDKNWRSGVEYIYNQLKGVLEQNGVKEINPIGEKFDPSRDEAIEYVKTDNKKEDHVILNVFQKGYSLNSKVVKAPKVKVGEFKE
jgi:molecular chaperone GrpE